MNCPECLEFLQQRLDGKTDTAPAGLKTHLAGCSDCCAWFAAAQRLQEGLRCLAAPLAPTHLTDSLVRSVVADQRRRRRLRRLVLNGAAVAAGVCIALLGAYRLANQSTREPTPQAQHGPAVRSETPRFARESAPSLGRSVDEARSAMAALTGDLGSTARRLLGSTAIPLNAKSITHLPAVAELEQPLEPAARSLRESGRGVSVSLAAVTGSARRAVDYFLREIPSLPGGKKTGL